MRDIYDIEGSIGIGELKGSDGYFEESWEEEVDNLFVEETKKDNYSKSRNSVAKSQPFIDFFIVCEHVVVEKNCVQNWYDDMQGNNNPT